MIKINLLPTKKKPPKKVIDLQQQVILALLLLVLLGMGMGYYWFNQNKLIAMLEKEKIDTEKLVNEQETKLKEVQGVEADQKKVTEKIAIIAKLKKNQEAPVRLLDEIGSALPPGVMIITLAETNSNISIDGEAFTNDDVVRFVENLKASRFLDKVMLLQTALTKREGIDVYSYKLQFMYKGM